MTDPDTMLALAMGRARLHPELLSDEQAQRVFVLGAFPAGREVLGRPGRLRVPPCGQVSLARWFDALEPGASLRPQLQILARFCNSQRFRLPASWQTAERIARSRGRAEPPAVAAACVLHSLLFGSGDASLRWVTRRAQAC
jgi:hypothetical protein